VPVASPVLFQAAGVVLPRSDDERADDDGEKQKGGRRREGCPARLRPLPWRRRLLPLMEDVKAPTLPLPAAEDQDEHYARSQQGE
jgi:hypothetical protein